MVESTCQCNDRNLVQNVRQSRIPAKNKIISTKNLRDKLAAVTNETAEICLSCNRPYNIRELMQPTAKHIFF
jgi:hypothetical protein